MQNTNILAHRGFWMEESEKNTITAFKRALEHNFGIETDVRDLDGELVISHDMPLKNSKLITLEDFVLLYKKSKSTSALAINVKADGLALSISKIFTKHDITNFFCFDMSVPDCIHYLNNKTISTYLRQSDIEDSVSFCKNAAGFWMDEMQNEWINEISIKHLSQYELPICIVSSELHKRHKDFQWKEIKNYLSNNKNSNQILICTDHPMDARNFFNS
jgi:hypothetical protein